MSDLLELEHRSGIAIVRIANPPVNALSADVREALHAVMARLDADSQVCGVVLAGAARGFCGGADIAEFGNGQFRSRVDPSDITALIEQMNKPVVAALHGFALGGGLEIALGCHYRVASLECKLGLPEIALGVLPGAGGTQRLPRLVGVSRALSMMLGGAPVSGKDAAACGLVDRAEEGDVVEAAVDFARRTATHGERRVTSRLPIESAEAAAAAITAARQRADTLRGQGFAAQRIVDCVQAAVRLPFDAGMQAEREAFAQCVQSPQAQALQHAFFAERIAGKAVTHPRAAARVIRTVGIVGAGTMGRGIAMSFVGAGFHVRLMDVSAERAQEAVKTIRAEFRRQTERGKLKAADAVARSSLVVAVAENADLAACDLVIEAVFEDLKLKLATCEQLGRLCRPDAIIASNTSTLDIDQLAQACGRPARFLGLHFFSPANIMRLVEVVRGRETSDETLATAVALTRQIAKVPVVSGVCWGFIGNRMLEPYLREVEFLLLEGMTPSRIDRALEAFGMAMGPCRMMDLAGVDVVAKVVEERAVEGRLPGDPLYRIVSRELARLGRYGQKTGEGFYRYKGRDLIDDVDAQSLIASLAARHQVVPRPEVTDEEIIDRCILPLVNEGFRILEDGISEQASDIDVVWLTGYGFPSSLGGPMYYAQRRGGKAISQGLREFAARRGDPWGYWQPAGVLQ